MLTILSFIERQKATRTLNKLTKRLSSTTPSSPDHASLDKQIYDAQVDLNYALFYPLHEKYTSLYPRTAGQSPTETPQEIGGKGQRKSEADRPPLWALVEKCMADGTLQELRDGKLGGGAVGGELVIGTGRPKTDGAKKGGKKDEIKKKASSGGVKLTGGAVSDKEDDDMSDGGFFE